MPTGVIINSLAVLFGGLTGAALGGRIPERIRASLTLIFGVSSMSMGVASIVKMNTLPAVVLSVIVGTAVGEAVFLERGIGRAAAKARGPVERLFKAPQNASPDYMDRMISAVVLFCASGTGIFGALQSGMTGDHAILLTKSILDFFTAMIFASTLGYLVAAIFIPQLIVLLLLFMSAAFFLPMATAVMLNDFTACGGILMLATGLRISGIKPFPIANMLPAMILCMPFSWAWANWITPLLS